MPEAEKNDAKYIGNKVRVKVNKKRSEKRERRIRASEGKLQNLTPEMMQPVDYQPPDSEKVSEMHEAGIRDGRELVKNSGASGNERTAEQNSHAGDNKQKTDTAVQMYGPAVPAQSDISPPGEVRNGNSGAYINENNRENGNTDLKDGHIKTAADNAAEIAPGKGKSDENKDIDEYISAQTEKTDKNQRKGRKKKKAEQKAARRASDAAVPDAARPSPAGEDGQPGEDAGGQIDPTDSDGTQVSGQDALTESGDSPAGKRLTVPRTVVMILSALFMLYAVSPLAVGVVTVGIIPPLCIGAFFFIVAYFWPRINACRNPLLNALFVLCGIMVIAGVTLIFYLFGLMYAASAVKPPADRSDYTVVVLGCKTIGDRPSLMLEDRLNAAAGFLKAHPDSYCVVSGGQGDDEMAPESTIMKRYLVSKGISELRIVEENDSSTTEENILNTCAMLDECNLYDDIVVVTDRFHQYRARHYVEKQGLRCYAVNSETRWFLAVHYWFKEMVAVGLLQLGYEI